MKSDEIVQAFSILARGFPNHPDVRTLADKLAEVFDGWVAPAKSVIADQSGMVEVAPGIVASASDMLAAPAGAVIPAKAKKAK